MPGESPKLTIAVTESDHLQGPADAAVVLIEYGDYQCPHCAKAAGVFRQLLEKHAGKLAVVYRHFPLGKTHPLAKKAAEGAEAAAAQGKFWEMHDRLFVAAGAITPDHLSKYAGELGLDVARFDAEVSRGKYAERIKQDIAGGARSGVNGTPTFFVNGRRHAGGNGIDALDAAIAEAQKPK